MFVILRSGAGGYVANAGCGRFAGAFRVDGDGIAFDLPVTMPGCPAHLEQRQQQLLDTLGAARRWVIHGQVLELFDAAAVTLAVAETVYFR
jgi:heat shock protein HslJ